MQNFLIDFWHENLFLSWVNFFVLWNILTLTFKYFINQFNSMHFCVESKMKCLSGEFCKCFEYYVLFMKHSIYSKSFDKKKINHSIIDYILLVIYENHIQTRNESQVS